MSKREERIKPKSKPVVNPLTYPANGEIFTLTLNGDDPANDPIEMVRTDGYDNPEQWKFTGKLIKGVQTRRFKLVSIGYCKELVEVIEKLKKHGEIPEGQWREALKKKFPKPDGKKPIGIADPSWVYPGGDVHFPFINSNGNSHFYWSCSAYGESWNWLVLCK